MIGVLPACGKKGPPLPPIRILPARAEEVRVRQVGLEVVLTASLPREHTDGTPLGTGMSVRVYRMLTRPQSSRGLSAGYLARQFEKEARLVATLSARELDESAAGGRLIFRDRVASAALPVALQTRLVYGLVVIDEDGKRSSLSTTAGIDIRKPLPPPSGFRLEPAEGEIQLTWKAPAGAPPKVLYNVYRRTTSGHSGRLPIVPLNQYPVVEQGFVDRTFQYGESYAYSVRALAEPAVPWQESAPVPEVDVTPQDVYPPAAPTGLSVAAEGGVIKLYWFPSSEPDLNGYHIYRRAPGSGGFTDIATVGASDSAYTDASAFPGLRYDYCVTAFDNAPKPNESPRSEVRSETLPADAAVPREETAP